MAVLVYKSLYGLAPLYLSDDCQLVTDVGCLSCYYVDLLPGNTPKFWPDRKSDFWRTKVLFETRQDRIKVTIDVQQEVVYALSIGAKSNDLG